jgi:two-component system NtrC family sensor kinase
MLDLARPSQDRADAIELNSLMRNSLDLLSHHLRRADVKTSLTCKEVAPVIYGNAPRLRQAFFSLLLNTCQKLSAGGLLEVFIDGSADEEDVIVISIFGLEPGHKGHDYSDSLASLFSDRSEDDIVDIGLLHSREVLDQFGAKFLYYDAGERGVPLVVELPIRSGRQAATHNE